MKKETVKTTKKGVAGKAVKSSAGASAKAEAASVKRQTRKGATKGKRRWLIGLAAVLLIAGGVTAAVCLWEHEAPAEEIVAEEVIEEEPEPEPVGPADGNEPLVPETDIPDWSAYTVAANKPRYLTIAAVDLYNVPIIEVGLTSGVRWVRRIARISWVGIIGRRIRGESGSGRR